VVAPLGAGCKGRVVLSPCGAFPGPEYTSREGQQQHRATQAEWPEATTPRLRPVCRWQATFRHRQGTKCGPILEVRGSLLSIGDEPARCLRALPSSGFWSSSICDSVTLHPLSFTLRNSLRPFQYSLRPPVATFKPWPTQNISRFSSTGSWAGTNGDKTDDCPF
jgi:hypothetical protein